MCRANVLVPVVLRLEDFDFHLTYEAVSLIIEFIYRGEVVIASNQLIMVANAAHSLGIDGLREFLPNVSPTTTQSRGQDHIQRGEHSRPVSYTHLTLPTKA